MVFTQEQIDAYKSQHPEGLQLIEVESGESCILREPNRQDFSYILACKDEIKMNDLMVNQLWVAGDEAIKTDFKLTLAVAKVASSTLFALKEATIKKL